VAGRSNSSTIRAAVLGAGAILLLSGCGIVSRIVTSGGGMLLGGGAISCSTFQVAADADGNLSQATLDDTVSVIQARLASLGVEASVEAVPPDLLTVGWPAGDDTAWRAAASRPGALAFVGIPSTFDQEIVEGDPLPAGIDPTPILDGSSILSAAVSADQLGKPAISLTLDAAGAAAFDAYAASHYMERFAMVVDGIVLSAPAIMAKEFGGKAQISGTFSDAEAANLAAALGSGPLPTAVREMDHSPANSDGTCTPVRVVQ